MTHLYLVRHGETSYNAARRIQGSVDIPLNERGIQQAEEAAEKLASLGVDAIVSSPMRRARQTAEIIARRLALDVLFMPVFVERRMGFFEGMPFQEISEKYAQEWEAWTHQFFASPPDAESIFDVSVRVKQGLDEIRVRFPDDTVLLVAHGFVGRVINGMLKRLPDEAFYQFLLKA